MLPLKFLVDVALNHAQRVGETEASTAISRNGFSATEVGIASVIADTVSAVGASLATVDPNRRYVAAYERMRDAARKAALQTRHDHYHKVTATKGGA